MKFIPILLIFFALLFPNSSQAQTNCDTLFFKSGVSTLINTNFTKSIWNIKFTKCGAEDQRIMVKKKTVSRIGINAAGVLQKKKAKSNIYAKVRLLDNTLVKGNLVGLTDSSLLLVPNKISIIEYNATNIHRFKLINKKRKTIIVLVGATLGTIIGIKIAKNKNSKIDESESFNPAVNKAFYPMAGFTVGFTAGSILANLGTIRINGNQSLFQQKTQKKKFRY